MFPRAAGKFDTELQHGDDLRGAIELHNGFSDRVTDVYNKYLVIEAPNCLRI